MIKLIILNMYKKKLFEQRRKKKNLKELYFFITF